MNQHQHHNSHHNSTQSLLRSKSVTFLDDLHNHHHHHQHHHGFDEFMHEASTNTEVSFKEGTHSDSGSGSGSGSGNKKLSWKYKKDKSNLNIPDRFGNPKASVGISTGRPMRRHVSSASDSLDYSLREKTSQAVRQEAKMKEARREHAAKREQERKGVLSDAGIKADLKSQFEKKLTLQIMESEKRRTDQAFVKNEQRNAAKRQVFAFNSKRVDSTKSNQEAKEQAKFDYLRSQQNTRNEQRVNSIQDAAAKEANKIAFKKVQQQERNKNYHDRILYEEAARQAQQTHVDLIHKQMRQGEKARERNEQKLATHKKYVKESSLLKAQNHFLNTSIN